MPKLPSAFANHPPPMNHRYTRFLLALLIPIAGMAQPPLDEVACYSFNGNANDGSGNNHDGTVSGATLTSDRFGTPSKAYSFDGVLDHIEVPDFNTFGISGEVSVGMWVRALTYTGNFAVSVWPDDFYDRFSAAPYYGHTGGSTIFWDFGDCTNGGRSSIIPYAFVSQWDHFTFTSSAANNRMRIYHNGGMILEEFHSSTLDNIDRALELGGGNVAGYSHWNGDLDEIVLYDRELNANEVVNLYTYGAPCQYQVGVLENAPTTPVITVDPIAQALVFSITGRCILRVLDAAGRKVTQMELGSDRRTWSYADLPAGAYIARCDGPSGSAVQKVVVE